MAKFNASGQVPGKTVNAAKGISYERKDARKELAVMLLNSMLAGDSFYEHEGARKVGEPGFWTFPFGRKHTTLIERIEAQVAGMCGNGSAEFVAKAMIYARTKGNLRSVSHLAAVLLAENGGTLPFTRKALRNVVVRPDDMTEIVALWDSRHPGKNGQAAMLPNALRRALRDVLESNRFDEYQFRKYQGLSGKVKLRDVVKLARPNPNKAKDATLFKRLLDGNLGGVETVQTMLSSGKNAAETTAHLMSEGKLGVMAALKNIRNALESGMTDEQVKEWCALVSDKQKLTKARVLPFRIYDAWTAVKDLNIDRFRKTAIRDALDRGLSCASGNFEFIEPHERIAIVLDESGSMEGGKIGNRTVFTVGKIMAASILTGLPRGKAVFYTFATTCWDRTDDLFTTSPISMIDGLTATGGGTYVQLPFEGLIRTKTAVDKIIILTDLQLYDGGMGHWGASREQLSSYLNAYKQAVGNPDVKLMFWNLQAYAGGTPIQLRNDVMEVVGYSDQMLSLIPKLWKDPDALVKEIEAVEL